MFGTIRKHQGWLWWVIIVIIICTFVIFFAPTSSYDNQQSGRGPYRGSIDGRDITDQEWQSAQREAYLRYFFMNGNWPDRDLEKSGFSPEDQTYQQLLLIRKLDELNIEADPASVAKAADTVMRQVNNGQPMPLSMFVSNALGNRVGLDDVERFFRHDVSIRQLVSVIGLSGQLVTPQEAKLVYERERRERATHAVFFSASNFLASVKDPATNALKEFYDMRQAEYHVPEKRQISYVAFPITNLLSQAEKELTNLTAQVEANMAKLGTNFLSFAKTPEDARVKIREELVRQRAFYHARQQANQFAAVLFNMQPERPDNLAELARTNGLTVKTTAPFDANYGPEDIKVNPEFTKAAFALSPVEEPFRGPLFGEDAVYVIAFANAIPSQVQPLEKIRDDVITDYKFNQAGLLAREAGARFTQTLTNGLAQGKTFAELCAAAKVKPVQLPPLSRSVRQLPEIEEHLSLPYYKQLAFTTPVGQASNFAPTGTGGVVVYVEKDLPLDPKLMEVDLPRFASMLRQQREQEAFYHWFNRQADKSLRRPQQPAPAPQALGKS